MFSSLEDHCRQNIYATVVFVRLVRLSSKCIYKLFVFQHFTSYIKTKEEGSVGEDLPGLALDHELHDVLGLLQLVKLVQLDLAHQHSAEDECLDVHLGLLLNLLS